jgi:hypothetical protein
MVFYAFSELDPCPALGAMAGTDLKSAFAGQIWVIGNAAWDARFIWVGSSASTMWAFVLNEVGLRVLCHDPVP